MQLSPQTFNGKACFKCNILKPLDQFYKHAQMADGHLNKCKACTKKDVGIHRKKNIDSIRAYDRRRGNRQTKEYFSEYRSKNPEKVLAHNAVNNAVRDGRLIKPTVCEDCNQESGLIHGHHDDYSKPLAVDWLCPSCHGKRHSFMDGDLWLKTGSPWIEP